MIDFMEGDCFNFSVALHRLYDLPIVFIYGNRNIEDLEGLEEVCIHTVCAYQDGSIDFEGLKGDSYQILSDYEIINDPYDNTDILTFLSEPIFWDLVHRCGGQKSEEVISKATQIILEEPRFDFLKKK